MKLGFLRKAADSTAKELAKRPHEIARYTLVALDPEISADEDVLIRVEEAVLADWNTMRGRFPDRPRQLLRAVLLGALGKLTNAGDTRFSAMVSLTGASVLQYIPPSVERDLLEGFLMASGSRAEEHAAHEWSPEVAGADSVTAVRIEAGDFRVGKVDRAVLKRAIQSAVGPHDPQSEALPNPNPEWPNSGETWAHEFAPRASAAVADAITQALRSADQTKALQTLLREHAKAVRAAIKSGLAQVVDIARVEQRKIVLLWWRETLYSPLARLSYRGLDPGIVSTLMAADLVNLVPPSAPRAVEHLLRETVRAVVLDDPGGDMPGISIPDLCGALGDEPLASAALRGAESDGDSRVPLATFLSDQLTRSENPSPKAVARRVGIPEGKEIPLDDLAVWLYRDLQVEALGGAGETS